MSEESSDPFGDHLSLPDYTNQVGHSSVGLSPITPSLPTRPPRYVIHERPAQPLIYTFMSWDSESMFLLPPRALDPGRGAVYYIAVKLNLNPFVPLSYVTSVHRGSDHNGEFVGEFELGVTHSRATVTIDGQSTRLKNILSTDSKSPRKFTWRHGTVELRWDCRSKLDDGSSMCICSNEASHQIASFVPPPLDASPPLPDATLTVFPDGHLFFDDIILSALVVERKMMLAG